MEMDQKARHTSIIGKIFLVIGVLILVVTSFSFNFIQFSQGLLEDHFENWNFELGIITINHPPFGLLYFIPAIYLCIGLIDIIVGLGLLAHKEWARIAALFIAIIFLFQFPLGTAFAVYIFYTLLDYKIVNKMRLTTLSGNESEEIPPTSA